MSLLLYKIARIGDVVNLYLLMNLKLIFLTIERNFCSIFTAYTFLYRYVLLVLFECGAT